MCVELFRKRNRGKMSRRRCGDAVRRGGEAKMADGYRNGKAKVKTVK